MDGESLRKFDQIVCKMCCLSNWKFERSSGYAGYRCSKCGTWVYAEHPKICDCDKEKQQDTIPSFSDPIDSIVNNYMANEGLTDHKCRALLEQVFRDGMNIGETSSKVN